MKRHVLTACLTLLPALLAAQTTPDPRLRLNRDTYHPAVDLLKEKRGSVTAEQLEELKRMPIESIWAALRRFGYNNAHVSGLKATRPREKLAGRALTIRYLPQRPDLTEAMTALAKQGDWPRAFNVRAAEEAKPGDVVVVDLGGGVSDGIFFGDISALGIQLAGAHGVVLWGSSRDYTELSEMKAFPIYAVGFDPAAALQIGVDWNVPIRVGGVTVLPGDVVVGDAEAVLFFPASIAARVIESVRESVAREDYERELARRKKHRFRDVYPLSPELRKQYEEQRGKALPAARQP